METLAKPEVSFAENKTQEGHQAKLDDRHQNKAQAFIAMYKNHKK